MNFYALYSKSRSRYCPPFLALDNRDAISLVSNMVVSQQDPALFMSLDDYTLEKVGAFRPDANFPLDGHTVTVDIVMDDLYKNLPLPPLVKEKVDQLYKEKEVKDE